MPAAYIEDRVTEAQAKQVDAVLGHRAKRTGETIEERDVRVLVFSSIDVAISRDAERCRDGVRRRHHDGRHVNRP